MMKPPSSQPVPLPQPPSNFATMPPPIPYNQPVHSGVDIYQTGEVEAVIWQNPNQYPQKAASEMLGPTEHTTNKEHNTRQQ